MADTTTIFTNAIEASISNAFDASARAPASFLEEKSNATDSSPIAANT